MPYLVKGNAEQIFSAFGRLALLNQPNARKKIDRDISKPFFLGTEADAKVHVDAWREKKAADYYTEGDMYARNLQFLLSDKPFMKEDELDEDYKKNYVCTHFAYINNHKKPCGLMIAFRKDNPSQWMMGVIINTSAHPKDREIILLSNTVSLKTALIDDSISVLPVVLHDNDFLQKLGFSFLQSLVRSILDFDQAKIKTSYERISLLLRAVVASQYEVKLIDPLTYSLHLPALFEEKNAILDLIVQQKINLSFAMLHDYLSAESQLHKELESLRLTPDAQINKNLIQMMIVFYEEVAKEVPTEEEIQALKTTEKQALRDEEKKKIKIKKLEKKRQWLAENYEFIRQFGGFMWDSRQIKLMPFMLKEHYDTALMQLILSKDSYYQAVSALLDMGFTQDVPELFKNTGKLKELDYIHALANESCKKLCLVFWVKGNLTLDKYKEIVAAAEKYPLMPDILVYLDKTGSVINGIAGLQTMALKPECHLHESIIHHFFRGDQEELYRQKLNELNQGQLEAVSKALHTLKISKRDFPTLCPLVLDSSNKGEALCVFLPQIEGVKDIALRQILIDVLYKGVTQGIVAQTKEVRDIKNSEQRAVSQDLCNRFFCVEHLQTLNFDHEIIRWAAEVNEKASCFRQLILQVDAQCKIISERLSSSIFYRESYKKINTNWQREKEQYRKDLYQIAYDAFTNKETSFNFEMLKQRVRDVEERVLATVDPDRKSNLYKAFILITNIVIAVLTVGIANYIKEKRTGNYLFFTQSESGENISALSKEVIRAIESKKSSKP